jgi:hypothetical protein
VDDLDEGKPAPDIAQIVPAHTNWGLFSPNVFIGNGTEFDIAVEVRLLRPPAPPARCGDSLDDSDSMGGTYIVCQLPEGHDGPHQDEVASTPVYWGP